MFHDPTKEIDPEHPDAANLAKVQQVTLFAALLALAIFGFVNIASGSSPDPTVGASPTQTAAPVPSVTVALTPVPTATQDPF